MADDAPVMSVKERMAALQRNSGGGGVPLPGMGAPRTPGKLNIPAGLAPPG
eukprot:CAMPEP_0118953608 /NCGR_PEP_ID=MMETSP1169-20130426/56872_1 /TAXON_ID=36882 /ORGANISM="Pyramimonas obovata, Strain CCMP722" /LENGTH=50 /DNA_ID=CAMNT_0006901111 /DNA_START=234 /DNA_END=383 /DNA_ORIENTATION=-